MKLRSYQDYKDSGVEWIGKIPEGWEVKRLKHFTENLDGKRIPISAENRISGIIPYYGATGIVDYVDDFIFNEELLLIGEDGAPFFDLYKDVSFIIEGKTWINNHAHVLRVLNEIHIKILMHQLNQTDYDFFIKGSTRDKLNQDQLKEIPIVKPSKKEQSRIISFLDKKTSEIDKTIEKDTKLIELLKEKRTALINHVVTKGLDPETSMKDSGIDSIGKIPKDWDIAKLKHISDINYGLALELDRGLEKGTRILSLPNVKKDGRLVLDNVPYAPNLTRNQEKDLILKKGDLLFNWRSGSPEHVGKTAYFNENGKFTHVSFLLRLRFNKEFSDSLYYHKYLNNLRNTGFFSFSKNQVNKTFNKTELDNLSVVVPPIEEQSLIANYIDEKTQKIDQTINKIQSKIDLLQEYKKSLIHHTVTGKIDVREVEA